jgi:hypothetical protein
MPVATAELGLRYQALAAGPAQSVPPEAASQASLDDIVVPLAELESILGAIK